MLSIESKLQAIKDISSASCNDEKDADNICGFCDEIYEEFQSYIDKVVEELEKLEEHCLDMCDWSGQSVADKAIEIVERGGMDEMEK